MRIGTVVVIGKLLPLTTAKKLEATNTNRKGQIDAEDRKRQ